MGLEYRLFGYKGRQEIKRLPDFRIEGPPIMIAGPFFFIVYIWGDTVTFLYLHGSSFMYVRKE